MVTLSKSKKRGDACRPLLAMDAEQTARYEHFRNLLDHNRAALSIMADLEQTYYDNRPFTPQMVERKCARLLSEVESMVQALSGLSSKPHEHLSAVLQSLLRYSKDELKPATRPTTDDLTLPISRIEADHDRTVGPRRPTWPALDGSLAFRCPKALPSLPPLTGCFY